MPLRVATHDGPFHADDVTAHALIRAFLEPDAELVRTRDRAVLATADVVFDVGGEYDASRGRFDHHQASYEGPLSSAGMVLGWLEARERIRPELAARLRETLVDYVDAVDNGREKPVRGRPCISTIVGMLGDQAGTAEAFDALFVRASDLVLDVIRGIEAGLAKEKRSRRAVWDAMDEAVASGRAVLLLDGHVAWKKPYFAREGSEHPTHFVLFPDVRDVRVVAIPPSLDSFAQKRPLPAAWAGLEGDALSAVTGVPGSIFCHKNRFIAAFATREAAERALRSAALWDAPGVPPDSGAHRS